MIIQMNKFPVICYSIVFISFIVLFLFTIIMIIFLNGFLNIGVLILSIILLVLIISLFLYLYIKAKYIKLIKNESQNLLIVKKINYLNCINSTFNFNLQNVILDIIKYQTDDGEDTFSYEALLITRMFNNNSDIDLNTTNIKNIPIKNLYYIFIGIKEKMYTSISLRNFLGINPEIENPANFNIYKYMGNPGNNITFSDYKLSRYMKMSDHYFTYFFEPPCCYCYGIIFPYYYSINIILFYNLSYYLYSVR